MLGGIGWADRMRLMDDLVAWTSSDEKAQRGEQTAEQVAARGDTGHVSCWRHNYVRFLPYSCHNYVRFMSFYYHLCHRIGIVNDPKIKTIK